ADATLHVHENRAIHHEKSREIATDFKIGGEIVAGNAPCVSGTQPKGLRSFRTKVGLPSPPKPPGKSTGDLMSGFRKRLTLCEPVTSYV
ncbi:hypothetical protein BaRGS_00006675, partial [Batillaria attramentaria]